VSSPSGQLFFSFLVFCYLTSFQFFSCSSPQSQECKVWNLNFGICLRFLASNHQYCPLIGTFISVVSAILVSSRNINIMHKYWYQAILQTLQRMIGLLKLAYILCLAIQPKHSQLPSSGHPTHIFPTTKCRKRAKAKVDKVFLTLWQRFGRPCGQPTCTRSEIDWPSNWPMLHKEEDPIWCPAVWAIDRRSTKYLDRSTGRSTNSQISAVSGPGLELIWGFLLLSINRGCEPILRLRRFLSEFLRELIVILL